MFHLIAITLNTPRHSQLAEVEEEEYGDAELEYNPSNGPSARLEEMYRDLEKAYNAQQKDLEELRSAYSVNQETSRALSDDLSAAQEANARLRRQHNAATQQIAKLEEERTTKSGNSESVENDHLVLSLFPLFFNEILL